MTGDHEKFNIIELDIEKDIEKDIEENFGDYTDFSPNISTRPYYHVEVFTGYDDFNEIRIKKKKKKRSDLQN